MNQTDHRGRGFAMFCLWTIAGTLLGAGVAYFIYARQAPVFESVASLKVVRAGQRTPVSTIRSSDPNQQQPVAGSATDVTDGSKQVSGFRMTDDESQDLVIHASNATQEASGQDSTDTDQTRESPDVSPETSAGTERESEPGQSALNGPSPDDRLLLCSKAVLERAVELGGLSDVQELRGMVSARDQSPEALVGGWVSSGSLRVDKADETSLGGVYQIAFRSRLPSTCEKVVQAVAEAAVESFDSGVLKEQQAKAFESLTAGRVEIDTALRNLEARLAELPEVTGARLRDGDVVSPDAIRLNAMVERFERLQQTRDGLTQNLGRAESLVKEGADRRLVLAALGAPPPQVKLASQSRGADADDQQIAGDESSKAAQEYRKWLEMRNDLIEKVEREVAPMQEKLDALIEKKYGPKHPAVSHLRGQIGRVRAQLANLPPEPDGVGIVIPGTDADASNASEVNRTDAEIRVREEGMSLVVLLKAMRSDLRGVSEELEQLDPELERLSTTVASQAKRLRQRQMIELEIQQQQSLRSSLIEQLEITEEQRTGSGVRCEILVPASDGVQVAPELKAHLLAGGMLGGASGAVLFLLITLSMSAVASDSKTED